MSKIFTFIAVAVVLFSQTKIQAQSFTVQHDTVNIATGANLTVINAITNTSSSPLTLQWKIVATNFPSDWIPVLGFCDNNLCYTGTSLWPAGTLETSAAYPVSASLGDFHMVLDLTGVTTTGTYYVRVRLNNMYGTASDTATETFIISKYPAAVPVVKSESDVSLYPNPATSELNVVYDASLDVKSISVYNIIGRCMTVYKVTGNTGANLHIENLSSGIYFVRLMNSHGDVVTTRRFTKQ